MITVKVIVNDTMPAPLRSEHGLAVWCRVEPIGGRPFTILLDTGQTPETLAYNAEKLGVDLSTLDYVLLSHGHYDHTGGLPALSGSNAKVIYAHGIEAKRFSVQLTSPADGKRMCKPIGLPCPDVVSSMDSLCVTGVTEILPWLRVFTLPEAAPVNPRLLSADGVTPDAFPDELFAIVSDGTSSLLYGGCTHHGLSQLLSFVTGNLGVNRIDTFVGGLHLVGQGIEKVKGVADAVADMPVSRWKLLHCTGDQNVCLWGERFELDKE